MENELILALGAFVIAVILWQIRGLRWLVYPLRLFSVYIHEIGHGLAAMATGGDFVKFEVHHSGGGLAHTRGGMKAFIYMAGYMGTAVLGSALLILSSEVNEPQWVALGLGGIFVLLTVFYSGISPRKLNILEILIALAVFGVAAYLIFASGVDSLRGLGIAVGGVGSVILVKFASDEDFFGVLVGVLCGLGLMAVGYAGVLGYPDFTLFVLYLLSFVLGLNVITDIWALSHTSSRIYKGTPNDAVQMAEATPFPAGCWIVGWVLVAVGLLGFAIWVSFLR